MQLFELADGRGVRLEIMQGVHTHVCRCCFIDYIIKVVTCQLAHMCRTNREKGGG
jgi:hypothetical protein